MNELFTLTAGLTLGVVLASGITWLRSWWIRTALILLTAMAATFFSGEYRVSWAFVVVDLWALALPLATGFTLVRYMRRHFGTGSI